MHKFILTCVLIANHAFALEPAEIQNIAAQPHDRNNLIEALAIYPDAREYRIIVKSGPSIAQLREGPPMQAKEKVVQGRYIVSEMKLPGMEQPMIMVVTYDKATDAFKKWVLLPDNSIFSSTGVADIPRRTIAWSSDRPNGNPPVDVISIETHTDDKTIWKETMLHDGNVTRIVHGTAHKTL
ncbi:MAG: hypothetical protein ACNA8L_08970 [Luteolibacter sp.]